MKTILITGARALIALEVARSFYKHGHRVIVADSLRWPIAKFSNTIYKYYRIPSPRFNVDKYVEAIQQIIEKENVNDFIPTCEEAVYVAQQKNKFNCKVWVGNIETVLNLHNKHSFAQCFNGSLPIPDTTLVSSFNDWDRSNSYVFKPVYSRFASNVIINRKIEENYFSESEKRRWISQRKVEGNEICIYSIWDNGTMKAFVAYSPVFRVGKGAGVFFKSVKNEQVLKHVRHFGESLKYTGQLSFDVIIDSDSKPYFIECNPRGTSGAHLINDKLAACFLGEEECVISTNKEYAIKYVMAMLHPFLLFKRRVRKSYDVVYRSNDKKPFYFQIFNLLEIAHIKFTKRVTWLQATTNDIEWNG